LGVVEHDAVTAVDVLGDTDDAPVAEDLVPGLLGVVPHLIAHAPVLPVPPTLPSHPDAFVCPSGHLEVTRMEHEAAIRAIQARQLALITREQALGVVSRRFVEHRLETGRWKRVLPCVYADSLVEPSLAQSALAALLWAGRESVVCFVPAGALWN